MSTIAISTSMASAQTLRQLHFTFAAVALASLAACGGGDDSPAPAAATPSPAPVAALPTPAPVPAPAPVVVTAPTPVAVTGKVIINQGIKNAMVCMDLNANSLCDTGEPASAATGADGVYTLSYDPSAITALQVAAAPMLAMIGTDAVDAADATAVKTKSYVLMAPAGRPAQINPLTTLVQTGIASGLSMAQSRTAVVVQLGIPDADIDDYQANASDLTRFLDNARNMAGMVAYSLEKGAALSVTDIAASTAPISQYHTISYTNRNNYYFRTFTSTDVAGTGKRQNTDLRSGLTAGVTTAQNVLYSTAYLTSTGWLTCDATGFLVTRGSPTRSDYCGGGLPSVGFTLNTDVSGKVMADVVRSMQAATDGSNSVTLDPAVLSTTTFPAGSLLYTRTVINTQQPIYISDLNSKSQVANYAGFASLAAFITDSQSQAPNLVSGAGMVYAGFTGDTSHWLMASFVDATSKAQYYSCTFNTAQTLITGCTALSAGTFSIPTVNGVKMIVFAGQPAPVATVDYTVGYAEYKGAVARYRQTRPETTFNVVNSQRLNDVAGDALRKALGV